jgi:hypothetical protein
MVWIKLKEGVWAEEVNNPKSIVTIEEMNVELNNINNQIVIIEKEPDTIEVHNDSKFVMLDELKNRKEEITKILAIK